MDPHKMTYHIDDKVGITQLPTITRKSIDNQ